MADDILVHHAQLSARGETPFYLLSIEQQELDGFVGVRGHILPADTFESRAAEYDIDPESPTGWDDILHVTLFNRWTGESAEEQLNHPDHLFNAPSIGHARDAALDRARRHLGRRKLRGVVGPVTHRLLMATATALTEASDSEDPLEFVKRTAPMSPEHMFVKREYARRRRNLIRVQRASQGALRLHDLDDIDTQVKRDMRLRTRRESPDLLAQRLLGEPPDSWTNAQERSTGSEQRAARLAALARDENDIPRDRLPSREGAPSKYL